MLANSQGKRLRWVVDDRVGEFFVGLHAAELLDVGVGLFFEHVDDVVDHHHADEPAGLVDHGGRDEVVALEQARHLFLVLGRLAPGRARRP